MLESTWLFIGLTAVLTTAFAALTQTQASRYFDRYADPIAIVAGSMGAVSWAILAYGALEIHVASGGTFTQPAVTVWCIMMALPNIYVALTGPMESLKRSPVARADDA